MKQMKIPFTELVEIVKREVKGDATPTEVAWLTAPENRKAWKAGLEAAIDDCLLQFDDWEDRLERVREEVKAGVMSQAAYQGLHDSYEQWRKKAGRYRLGLEQKLLEVAFLDDDRDPAVELLSQAILEHREDLIGRREATQIDMKLWSLIEKMEQ